MGYYKCDNRGRFLHGRVLEQKASLTTLFVVFRCTGNRPPRPLGSLLGRMALLFSIFWRRVLRVLWVPTRAVLPPAPKSGEGFPFDKEGLLVPGL